MTNYCSQCGGRIASLEEGCVICRGAVGTGERAAASIVDDSPERLVAEISSLLQAESSPAPAARAAHPPHTSAIEPDVAASRKAEPAEPANFAAPPPAVAAAQPLASSESRVEPERQVLDIPEINAGRREETAGINFEDHAAALGEGREKSLGEAAAVLSASTTEEEAEGETVRIAGAGGLGTAAAFVSTEPDAAATDVQDAPPHSTLAATSHAPSTDAVRTASAEGQAAATAPRGASGGRGGVLAHAPLAGLLSLVVLALSTFLLWFTVGGGDGAKAITGLTRGDGQLILGLTCLALVAGVRSWRRQVNRTLGYMAAGGWGTFVLCYLTGLIKHLVATGEVRTAAGLYVGAAAGALAAVTFVLGAMRESGLAGGGATRRRGQVFGAHAVAVIAGIMLSGLVPKYIAPTLRKDPGVKPAPVADGGEQRTAKKTPLVVSGEESETLSSAPVVAGDAPQTGQTTAASAPADSPAVQETGNRAGSPAPAFVDVDPGAIPDVPDIPIARGRPSGARQRRAATSPAPSRRGAAPESAGRSGGGKGSPAGAPAGGTPPGPNPNTWRPGRQP